MSGTKIRSSFTHWVNSMQLHFCIATKKNHLTKFINARAVYDYRECYNIAINQFAPAIMNHTPNEIVELKWHYNWNEKSTTQLSYFIPLEKILSHWKQPRTIRFELLKAIRDYRCVVLANCFVVWKETTPYCVYIQDQRLFAFGAIWKETASHTGFAFLTQPANELLLRIGQKYMPLILKEREIREWLNKDCSSSRITCLMRTTYPGIKMNAYPIGPEINDLNNNHRFIYTPTGERLNPELDYGVKERLVRQGWGRSKQDED